jgi:hypothetical protein
MNYKKWRCESILFPAEETQYLNSKGVSMPNRLSDEIILNEQSYEQILEEADTISDLNVFSFWEEEILTLYITSRNLPKEEIFRRALQRSNLVEPMKDRYIWSEYGLALIEKKLRIRV